MIASVTSEDLEFLEKNLSDPIWRLCNLYKIKDAKSGKMIPFEPTKEQMKIINAIHVDGISKILILKARQLGMSTVINVIMADLQIWNEGIQQAIVDEDQKAAALKLKYKVKAAYDSMPEEIRGMFEVVTSNDSQFSVRFKGKGNDQASTIFAGKNTRGGTNQFLHVSEWGPIQHDDPPRSEEIMTGALPSAKAGIVAVETTWKGGKGGQLWEITDRAMTTTPENMTPEDYTLFFFPWYHDPQYQTSGNFSQLPPEVHQYFDGMEQHFKTKGEPHKFTAEQRLWYYKVAMPKGAARFAEYPTTLEECFMAPVPGAIYASLMDQARAEGRIIDFEYSKDHFVHTFWDLGSPENTRVIYVQFIGDMLHVIDHDTGLDLGPTERVSHMRRKGYQYGGHHLPHDAGAKEKSGQSFEEQLVNAGLLLVDVVPRCAEIWTGINKGCELMPRLKFHKTRCRKLIESLDSYHTKEDKTRKGHQTSIPVHDWSSHDADAYRQIGEAMMAGIIKNGRQPPPRVISPIEGLGSPSRRNSVLSPLD